MLGMGKKNIFYKETNSARYSLICFISVTATLLGLIMGIFCLKEKNIVQTYFCFSYFALFLFVSIFTIITKRSFLFLFSMEAFMSFCEFFYLKTGGFGLTWLTVIPFFSVYILNTVNYYSFNTIFFLILEVAFWTPLCKYCSSDITLFYKIRISILYFIEILFGCFLRTQIAKTEKNLEKQKNILSAEIKNAAQIQKAFLSRTKQTYKNWSIGTKNVPMIGVTGDLYCVFNDNDKLEGLGLFDISGHGISSGLLTMLAKNTIEQQFYNNINSNSNEELWETVEKINEHFIEEKGEVQNYLTGILIKIRGDSLEIVNAGQQEPILYRKKTNSFEYFKKDNKSVGAIGISNFPTYFISQHLEMEPGDELFLFTDGLSETENEEGDRIDLIKIFGRHLDLPADQQAERILEDITDFCDKKINDDLTLTILRKD